MFLIKGYCQAEQAQHVTFYIYGMVYVVTPDENKKNQGLINLHFRKSGICCTKGRYDARLEDIKFCPTDT